MIKATPPPTRDEVLEMLFLLTLENKEFEQMILPTGLLENPPSRIGHIGVIESDFVEKHRVVFINTENSKW